MSDVDKIIQVWRLRVIERDMDIDKLKSEIKRLTARCVEMSEKLVEQAKAITFINNERNRLKKLASPVWPDSRDHKLH